MVRNSTVLSYPGFELSGSNCIENGTSMEGGGGGGNLVRGSGSSSYQGYTGYTGCPPKIVPVLNLNYSRNT